MEVTGADGPRFAPAFSARYGFIDFGPNFSDLHIMETWTLYRPFSPGNHSGFQQMWWDDDTDIVNDGGAAMIENRINFNSAGGVPNATDARWIRDTQTLERGGIRPKARYLMVQASAYPQDINANLGIAMATQNPAIQVQVANNIYDASRTTMVAPWAGGSAVILESNSEQRQVTAPVFVNLTGGVENDLLKWTRWTAKIGEGVGFPSAQTNKGQKVNFAVGEIVQHHHHGETVFYRCLIENSESEPPVMGDARWKRLQWIGPHGPSNYPPDDARLLEGSYYFQRGIGLRGGGHSDVDLDGVDDAWEARHGIDVTVGSDRDSNGCSDLEEFLMGTDPIDPQSLITLQSSIQSGSFNTVAKLPAGRWARWESAQNLDNP